MPLSDANEGISDECLMDAIVRGESAAMEMLYRRYRRLFFCMAYRSTSNKQTAEDLIQVAFLTIWQHRTVYTKELGSARSWLLSIMRHRILDEGRRWRSRSAWKKVPWEEMEESALLLAPDPWEQAWHREQAARLQEAILQLPGEQRTVIVLAYVEGLTHHEVAKRCHIPLGTAKSRLRLGLCHLKHALLVQDPVER